ncbi:MAG: hypothetical protein LKJ76_10475 [Lachnospiraceae bacterium]|jgi:hypothetical protein|nr:hypothetical protein [Lachnospiraceae bacterium]
MGQTVTSLVTFFILLIIILSFTMLAVRQRNGGAQSRDRNAPAYGNGSTEPVMGSGNIASDGHRMRASQDITCARYGHSHPDEDQPRYIVHDDPEIGFVILNGKKVRLQDCRDL